MNKGRYRWEKWIRLQKYLRWTKKNADNSEGYKWENWTGYDNNLKWTEIRNWIQWMEKYTIYFGFNWFQYYNEQKEICKIY